jgi:asparagine synthase (glutamine-hydrolysing)
LHLGYIPEPHTIFERIHKFPAGCVGVVNGGLSLTISNYWKPEDYVVPLRSWTERDAKDALKLQLHQAVEKRMISDVPLGAFLSGGTDSSLISAIASGYSSSALKTFSIGFKEDSFNESKYAEQVAKHLKTDHHEYILSEHEAVSLLESYLNHFDEPFADTSAIPTMLVSRLARKEVTVALTGDGGDELFLGYGSYDWANRLSGPIFNRLPSLLISLLENYGSNRLKRIAPLFKRVGKGQLRSHIFSQEQYIFSQGEVASALLKNGDDYKSFTYNDVPQKLTAAEQQALFDVKFYLKDDLLVKVDRSSMYYGLECRCPLLDHHVVELALGLPYSVKKKDGQRKWILKELLKEYLPDDLIYRPKWGFSVPLARWLKRDLAYLVDRYLNQQVIEEVGVVNYSYVQTLKNSFAGGQDFLYNRLWVLIVLHKWLHENR